MQMKILTGISAHNLSSRLEDHMLEGWIPVGSHQVVVLSSTTHAHGGVTTNEIEYSITIKR